MLHFISITFELCCTQSLNHVINVIFSCFKIMGHHHHPMGLALNPKVSFEIVWILFIFRMLTHKEFAFFQRILQFVSKFNLHPFAWREGLLLDMESWRTRLIGRTAVMLHVFYTTFFVYRIFKATSQTEGIMHFFLILGSTAAGAYKMSILFFHSELINVVNNIVLLNQNWVTNSATNIMLILTRIILYKFFFTRTVIIHM